MSAPLTPIGRAQLSTHLIGHSSLLFAIEGGNCLLQHGNKLLFHSVFVTKRFSYDLCNKEILLKISSK